VTVGALLGIKLIGRHAEHVVALDADAMNDRADDCAGLGRFVGGGGRRSDGLLGSGFRGHGRILARGGVSSKEDWRHPGALAAHL
jgi:hypothetical protein